MDIVIANTFRLMANQIKALELRVEQLERRLAEMDRKEFLALPKDMDLQDQIKALERHKNTPMTYSELRDRFG